MRHNQYLLKSTAVETNRSSRRGSTPLPTIVTPKPLTNTKHFEYLNSVLDVNASWREQWNEFGCLAAFEYDFLLGGDVFTDALTEEFGLSEEEAADCIFQHVVTCGYVWSLEIVKDNFDKVWEILEDNGGDPEDTLRNFDDSLESLVEAKLTTLQ